VCVSVTIDIIYFFIFLIMNILYSFYLLLIYSLVRTYRNVFLGRIRIPMNEIAASGDNGKSEGIEGIERGLT
jgi:hypothetical protein